MVGSGVMAKQHSAAYHLLPIIHGNSVPPVELVRIAGGRRVHDAATHYGWKDSSDDWRAVIEADDIDIVDIVTPNDSHAELTISAAARGKHVICEKPLARDTAEAIRMRDAVRASGVHTAVCFVYRTWPATQAAKALIDAGRLGKIHGYRGHFLHDHFTGRDDPAAWRLDPTKAGSGVIGDIGSHAFDLATYLIGDIAEVFACSRTCLPTGSAPVDDEADVLLRFTSGATGHLWLSWLATGTPMDLGFLIMGDEGSLQFSWNRPGELRLYDGTGPADTRGYTTIPLGPAHPAAAPYLPVAGLGMGYEQAFVPLLAGFLTELTGQPPQTPTIEEAVVNSTYLDTALHSAGVRTWQAVDLPTEPPPMSVPT